MTVFRKGLLTKLFWLFFMILVYAFFSNGGFVLRAGFSMPKLDSESSNLIDDMSVLDRWLAGHAFSEA